MKFNINVMGHSVDVKPKTNRQQDTPGEVKGVDDDFISKLNETLIKYTNGKRILESKIVENERWFRMQHWDLVRGDKVKDDNEPEPVTAYLLSTIINKHADAMDYYPEPNILEREEDDVEEAGNLTKVIPLVLEQNNFRDTYSKGWWYKLKQGVVPYGIFWNDSLNNGMGDIDIQKLDILNIYWEPGVTDIQKSRYLFIVTLIDDEVLHEMYPETADRIGDSKPINIQEYVMDDHVDTQGKSLIIDAYYKKNINGREIVHLTKYVDSMLLDSSENYPESAETGMYDHGKYPVEFDVLFPEENTPVGFGFIDIVKNPQIYIDKLDQSISKNALVSGKYRTIIKENGSINEEELADLSKEIIHTQGGCKEGEDFAILQGKPLPAFIVNHRESKIQELKETSGDNQFSRGEGGQGITAASAILALQEAGNKVARDMIGCSYNSYSRMVYMCIELIRQFYDEDRKFRSKDDTGNAKYITYNNANLQKQPLPPAYDGEGMIMDEMTGEMVQDPNYEPKFRQAMFDIRVKPEKASPFAKAAQNEMAKEMFNLGMFNPQRAVEAKLALEMMSFEGKEKILQVVAQNGDLFLQLQQLQQELAQAQQAIDGMNEVIKATTGRDMMKPQPPQLVPLQGGGANGVL